MYRRLIAAVIALAAGAASAQDDPLQSPVCREALDALRAEEAALPPASAQGPDAAASAALQRLRHRAARACLASRADPPPSGRAAQPPLAVPPTERAPAIVPPAIAVPPPAPLPVQRPPAMVSSCDATGCWASDGTRLHRAGPNLIGPRGLCTVSGKLVQCF